MSTAELIARAEEHASTPSRVGRDHRRSDSGDPLPEPADSRDRTGALSSTVVGPMIDPRPVGESRPVLLVTAIAMTMMSHAIRTQPTILPGWRVMWWGVFAAASACAALAAWRLTHTSIAIAGAATVVVFVSRALAVILGVLTDSTSTANSALLAIVGWTLIAYYAGIVFWHLSRDAPKRPRA